MGGSRLLIASDPCMVWTGTGWPGKRAGTAAGRRELCGEGWGEEAGRGRLGEEQREERGRLGQTASGVWDRAWSTPGN